jgi:cellobiose-specific phosphotransferase system component IIA
MNYEEMCMGINSFNEDNYSEMLMGMIVNGGDARDTALKAIQAAKKGDFEESDVFLKIVTKLFLRHIRFRPL